ncbi:RNA polymerase sigma factor [Fibrobacterota bacterium]
MPSEQRQNRFTQFFRDEYARMVNYVRGKAAEIAEQDAEDIVQDVVFNMVDRADIASPIENLIAYAYQALRNRIIDSFRTRKKKVSLDQPLDESAEVSLADIISDTRYQADESYNKQKAAALLSQVMGELSDEEKAVVIAVELEGYSFNELSDKWDVPVNTLLSRKSRAMKKIKEKFIHLQRKQE